MICNEMIKSSFETLSSQYICIFNSILSSNCYPRVWKQDILGPIHKSGAKDDPGNFRGISLSSCLGKFFCSLLRNRLEKKCSKSVTKFQISGKIGVRTTNQLLVCTHLFDKYVKTNYGIGGNFLKILINNYEENGIFVKRSQGLTQPIRTTTGVKQGCVLSPLCFNLFIYNLCSTIVQEIPSFVTQLHYVIPPQTVGCGLMIVQFSLSLREKSAKFC